MTKHPDNIEEVLPVKLSDAEITKKARLLAQCINDYAQIEDDAKKSAANWSKCKSDKRVEMERISRIIGAGAEPQPVVCRWVEDFEHGVRRLVRQDTGDNVREETLTAEDMQRPLGFDS